MDLVEQISNSVHNRVDLIGDEIVRVAELNQVVLESRGLSGVERAKRIGGARDVLNAEMDIVFGDEDGSINSEIQHILENSNQQAAALERGRAAAEIWWQELPGLRRYLEYCSGMIASHPEKICDEVRRNQKCLTEASIVLEKISTR